jgi:UMF1 family MFS transporter
VKFRRTTAADFTGASLQTYSWALYDWANSAFATAVMAGFFPVLFRQYWSLSRDVTVTTFRLGVVNSVAGMAIAVSAPLLGAVADRLDRRKAFLIIFAVLGVVMTGGLSVVPRGDYFAAGFLYILATLGFMGGNVFYDSLLLDVASPGLLSRVSALGYSLGYIGGGVLFAVCVGMVLAPGFFGFATKTVAARTVFLLTAVWWGIFSVPLFLFVREKRIPRTGSVEKWGRGLLKTLRMIMGERRIWMFLAAYWLYIDGVGTVIRMAVDYGMSLGLGAPDLMRALLITQFVGFPATLLFGKLGDRIGTKRSILIGLAGYLAITIDGVFLTNARDFYILAVGVGIFQGGVQSLSRAFFAGLVPDGREASYFGVYNMLGRFAAVLGPFVMGLTAFLTSNPAAGIISVALFFITGGIFLLFVPEKTN